MITKKSKIVQPMYSQRNNSETTVTNDVEALKDRVTCGSSIARAWKNVKEFFSNFFIGIWDVIKFSFNGFCDVITTIFSGLWSLLTFPCRADGQSILIVLALVVMSGIIAVPVIDKTHYNSLRKDWLSIHHECQCKFVNATTLMTTCDNVVESITFTNSDNGIIGISRECFIEHPIKNVDSIKYDNPYSTYYFLGGLKYDPYHGRVYSDKPLTAFLLTWFILAFLVLGFFTLIASFGAFNRRTW